MQTLAVGRDERDMPGVEDFDIFHRAASIHIANSENRVRHDDAIVAVHHSDAAVGKIGLHALSRYFHRHKVGGALGKFFSGKKEPAQYRIVYDSSITGGNFTGNHRNGNQAAGCLPCRRILAGSQAYPAFERDGGKR